LDFGLKNVAAHGRVRAFREESAMQTALKLNVQTARKSNAVSVGEAGRDSRAVAGGAIASLTVRPAVRSDRVGIGFFFDAVLRNDYFLRRGQLKEMLDGRFHQVWIAEIDRVLVGIAVTTRGTRLVNALVHPGYRGLGIGRALVEASGATEVRAKIDMKSGDPRGFYEAMGFRGTGERNGKGNIEVMRRRHEGTKGRRDVGTQQRRVSLENDQKHCSA
jgi:GNAT superfamily N-acetyltransferase